LVVIMPLRYDSSSRRRVFQLLSQLRIGSKLLQAYGRGLEYCLLFPNANELALLAEVQRLDAALAASRRKVLTAVPKFAALCACEHVGLAFEYLVETCRRTFRAFDRRFSPDFEQWKADVAQRATEEGMAAWRADSRDLTAHLRDLANHLEAIDDLLDEVLRLIEVLV
jgi:hypothetical protein